MIRVVVVDDDPEVRAAVASVLGSDSEIVVAAEAVDGREALTQITRHDPDVVVLDVRMPGLGGLEVLEQLPPDDRPGVLMLTTFGEADYVRRAIALGADGFLLKAGDPHDLVAAVRGTAEGESWISPSVARWVTRELRIGDERPRQAARAALVRLTARERDVVELVAEGASNAEIGARLHLAESTVKAYVSSALDTLGRRNRVELAALVWEAGQRSR